MLDNDTSYHDQILECVIYNSVLLENEIQYNGHIVKSRALKDEYSKFNKYFKVINIYIPCCNHLRVFQK